MDKGTKRQRAVELLKDVLIVLLTCSALWLVARGQILGPLGLLREESLQTGGSVSQGSAGLDAARPLRITASMMGETGPGRCGIQYDQAVADSLFQQVAGLLVEALSSAGEPEQVTRRQWEQALITPPSVCLDFQGEVPMSVLTGWLTGEERAGDALVRRLVLTVWEDWVALYYQDGESGVYYRCLSEVANSLHLTEALTALQDNGAFYAFESEAYAALGGETLISAQVPVPKVYSASNPVSGGRDSLSALMEELGLSANPNSYYYAGSAHVGRSGNDTLRLFDSGMAVYESEEGSDHFLISSQGEEPTLLEAVEACRKIASVLSARCGQARLFLGSVVQGEDGLEVSFEYSLNGSQVRLEGGSAASFLIRDGRIIQFALRFRSYADSGETSVVMPYLQAAAALEAQGREGEELLLVYVDGGGDPVSASWAANSGVQ